MKSRVDFFNSMAQNWDNMIVVDKRKINYGLETLNIKKGFKVLDVGTGTGVMLPFILERIGEEGRIVAVDISKNMLKVAQKKFKKDKRIKFVNKDIENDKISERFDSIVCYNVFPHFSNKITTIKKLVVNNLKSEGKLLIFHSQSKENINNIHKEAADIVSKDKLIDLDKQIKLFEKAGITVLHGIDNKEMYLILIGNGSS